MTLSSKPASNCDSANQYVCFFFCRELRGHKGEKKKRKTYLVQTNQHMAKIQNWLSIHSNAMEDIIPEKFEDVPIARIRPTRVQFKPSPIGDLANFPQTE